MTEHRKELTRFGFTPIAILAYGAYYLSGTWGGRFETVGYGALCGSILIILTLIIASRGVFWAGGDHSIGSWILQRPVAIRDHAPALVMCLSMWGYVYFQSWIGFLPATSIMALWLLIFLRAGGGVRIGALTLALSGLAWLLLLHLLNVPLPTAPWVA
ncbi:hypothetical protein KMP13_17285 [Epibacterium ulvae]|uniref:tripartite tricarboxylate transporter TctB family protein n=1 Tax=Epibacterium ulvae TaxID=1156985 RepID=UPI001BFC1B74|nr:tripartite tricarboxylate transporter TctB family protein [Epibacterium ulvae]MBT8155589.1 hypothetical protein [Epibacterium ulvae]